MLIPLSSSVAFANPPCDFEFLVGERSAFVCNELGEIVPATICRSSNNSCSATNLEPGISVFERPADTSHYLSISVNFPDGDRYFLAEGFEKQSFDWSRIVYLIAGSLIAFFAGYGSRYISFIFEQRSGQRQLVRQWRDDLIRAIRAATEESAPDLSFAPPSGMASKNVRRAMKIHDQLQSLFNKVRLGQLDVEAAKAQALEKVLSERAG